MRVLVVNKVVVMEDRPEVTKTRVVSMMDSHNPRLDNLVDEAKEVVDKLVEVLTNIKMEILRNNMVDLATVLEIMEESEAKTDLVDLAIRFIDIMSLGPFFLN